MFNVPVANASNYVSYTQVFYYQFKDQIVSREKNKNFGCKKGIAGSAICIISG